MSCACISVLFMRIEEGWYLQVMAPPFVPAGCPIDIICERGAGSALLTRPKRLEQVVRATTACIHKPVIVKIRCAGSCAWDVVSTRRAGQLLAGAGWL